jgi:hypothetical protein
MDTYKEFFGLSSILGTFIIFMFLPTIWILVLFLVIQLIILFVYKDDFIKIIPYILSFKVRRTIYVFVMVCYLVFVYNAHKLLSINNKVSIGETISIIILAILSSAAILANFGFVPNVSDEQD